MRVLTFREDFHITSYFSKTKTLSFKESITLPVFSFIHELYAYVNVNVLGSYGNLASYLNKIVAPP